MDLNRYEHRPSRPSASPTTDGLSNWVLPDLDALPRQRGRLLQVRRDRTQRPRSSTLRHRGQLPQGCRDWTNRPVYKARAASPPSRPAMVSRSSPITNLFSLAVIGSSRADSLDKTPTVHPRAPRTTPALPVPMALPIRPRARLLRGRHVRSHHARRGPVTLRASPRLTTARSGPPPGPSAGSSARGCSARGTNGAIDPGSLK